MNDLSDSLPSVGKVNRVLRNTFFTLALTMLTTVFGAYLGVQNVSFMQDSPWLALVLFISLGLILIVGIISFRNSGFGLLLLFIFTVVMGFSTGGIINYALELKNGHTLIMLAFLGTATSLGAMTFVAMFSGKDFSYLGSGLFAVLLALVVIEFLNLIFFQAPMLMVIMSMVGAVLFSMYILYDVSNIVNGHEDNYIVATLSIYLDVLNLFLDLLRGLLLIFGEGD